MMWFMSREWVVCLSILALSHSTIVHADEDGPTTDEEQGKEPRSLNEDLVESEDTCDSPLCVRKCCQDGELFVNYQCVPTNSSRWRPDKFLVDRKDVDPAKLQVVFGMPPLCSMDEIILIDNTHFSLLQDGMMLAQNHSLAVPPSNYCLEYVQDIEGVLGLYCSTQEDLIPYTEVEEICQFHEVLYPILMSFSCFFLILTLAVYAGVPTLRGKTYGRCLISLVSSLIIFYIMQISNYVRSVPNQHHCLALAFLMHVNGLAIFFWLNVMAFELWMTVRSQSPVLHSMKKFMKYSLYAWGCSLLIGLVTVVIDFLPQTASFEHLLRPKLAGNTCFLEGKLERWAYLYWVILAITVINMCFFLHICYTIHKSKTTVKKRGNHFWLFAKMFLIMGLTWILDIFSTRDCYWVIGDIFNLLQGVFIFIATVCNRTVFKEVLNRLSPRFHGLGDFWQNVSKKVSTHTAAPPSTAITATASSALIFSKDSSGHQYRHSLGKGVDQSINKCGQDNYTVMSLDNNRGFTSATNEVNA